MNSNHTFFRVIAALALSVAAAASVSVALACPICMGLRLDPPIAERLTGSEEALLVRKVSVETGQFRVAAAIKGKAAVGEILSVPELAQKELPETRAEEALLVVREPDARGWSVLGKIRVADAPLLREFAALKSLRDLNDDARRARLAYFAPKLEDARPLIAEAAYQELAQAPYGSLRALKPVLDRDRIRRWVADPKLYIRQPLYLLLLGIAGDASDVEQIEKRIYLAWLEHTSAAAHLSALLAADLEMRGEPRVDFIERSYIMDRTRTGDEISAALLALSVHGSAAGAVSRERVIGAYRLLIHERAPLAAYVAPDLAAWKYWGMVPEYTALLKSDTLHYSSRVAIVSYLRASPNGKSLAIDEPGNLSAAPLLPPNIVVVPQ